MPITTILKDHNVAYLLGNEVRDSINKKYQEDKKDALKEALSISGVLTEDVIEQIITKVADGESLDKLLVANKIFFGCGTLDSNYHLNLGVAYWIGAESFIVVQKECQEAQLDILFNAFKALNNHSHCLVVSTEGMSKNQYMNIKNSLSQQAYDNAGVKKVSSHHEADRIEPLQNSIENIHKAADVPAAADVPGKAGAAEATLKQPEPLIAASPPPYSPALFGSSGMTTISTDQSNEHKKPAQQDNIQISQDRIEHSVVKLPTPTIKKLELPQIKARKKKQLSVEEEQSLVKVKQSNYDPVRFQL